MTALHRRSPAFPNSVARRSDRKPVGAKPPDQNAVATVTAIRTATGAKKLISRGVDAGGSPSSPATSCIGAASSRVTFPVVHDRCSAVSISP